MTVTVYGIKACDTMKKAFTWLDEHQVDWQFHDYKKSGIGERELKRWIKTLGWENVINRRGTSWRKLSETERESMSASSAVQAAIANPSLIRRPIVEGDGILELGFDPARWAEIFK